MQKAYGGREGWEDKWQQEICFVSDKIETTTTKLLQIKILMIKIN
jgi:hypothetical protein